MAASGGECDQDASWQPHVAELPRLITLQGNRLRSVSPGFNVRIAAPPCHDNMTAASAIAAGSACTKPDAHCSPCSAPKAPATSTQARKNNASVRPSGPARSATRSGLRRGSRCKDPGWRRAPWICRRTPRSARTKRRPCGVVQRNISITRNRDARAQQRDQDFCDSRTFAPPLQRPLRQLCRSQRRQPPSHRAGAYDGRISCGRCHATVCRPFLNAASGCAISATACSGDLRIDDDDVGRIADREAVVLQVHQPRRAVGEHLEAVAQLRRRGRPAARWHKGSPCGSASSRHRASPD